MTKIQHFFQQYKTFILITVISIASFLGIAFIIYATNYGPWVFSDSTSYIWTARNLAEGRGLVLQNPLGSYELLIWHPPLFPLLLSFPIGLGIEVLQAIRWINALSFGITIFIAGIATWRYTRSAIATIGVTALIVSAIDLIFVFSGAMSEAIFFVLGLGSLFLLVESFHSRQSSSLLFLAGFLAGLSYLARYAGIIFVGTVILIPLLFIQKSIGKRFLAMLPGGLPALIIPLGWTIIVFLNNETIGGRNMLALENLRLNFSDYTQFFWNVITAWFPYMLRGNHILPAEWKFIVGIIIVLIVLSLGLKSVINKRDHPEYRNHLIWLSTIALFFFAYLGFHFISYIFSSAAPAIDRRLLSPLLLSGTLLLGAIFSLPLGSSTRIFHPAIYIFIFYVIIFLFYFQGKTQSFLFEQHHFGLGYTSKRWQESQLIHEVLQLNPQIPLISNDPALILFYSGRFPHSFSFPENISKETNNSVDNAYYIFFRHRTNEPYWSERQKDLEEFNQYCNVVYEDSQGYICYWER